MKGKIVTKVEEKKGRTVTTTEFKPHEPIGDRAFNYVWQGAKTVAAVGITAVGAMVAWGAYKFFNLGRSPLDDARLRLRIEKMRRAFKDDATPQEAAANHPEIYKDWLEYIRDELDGRSLW